MSDKYTSKSDVIAGVTIESIAIEFNIELENITSGNFNYKCKCPSLEHKGGMERNSSCYIDSSKNNFFCFSCNVGSNCIDFYMLCADVSFSEAMIELKKRVIPGTSKSSFYEIEPNNFYVLLQISKLFRETMQKHKDDLEWINKLMHYSDQFILKLESKEENKARVLFKKIKNKIESRYK